MGTGGSSTTTTQELSPEQQQILELAMPTFEEFINNPPQVYEGSVVQPFTPKQERGFDLSIDVAQEQDRATRQLLEQFGLAGDAAGDLAGQASDLYGTAGGLFESTGQQAEQFYGSGGGLTGAGAAGAGGLLGDYAAGDPARDFILGGGLIDPEQNAYLDEYVQAAINPLTNELTRSVLPGIQSEAITAGGLGGSRQGVAEGMALESYMQQVGDISSSIYSDAYGQGLDATMGVLSDLTGVAPQVTGQLLGTGTDVLGLGNQATGLQNEALGVQGQATGLGADALALQLENLIAQPEVIESLGMKAEELERIGGEYQALKAAGRIEEANKFMLEQMMPLIIAQDITGISTGFGGGSTTSQSQESFDPLSAALGGFALFL